MSEWHCIIKETEITKKYLPFIEVAEHPLKPITVTILDNRNARKINVANSSTTALTLEPLSLALDGCDPLTLFAKQNAAAAASSATVVDDIVDPLSQMVAEYDAISPISSSSSNVNQQRSSINNNNLRNHRKGKDILMSSAETSTIKWNSRRGAILSRYTTSEKLSIVTSFLTGGDMLKTQTQTTIADKVKHRLEQLDDFDDCSVHHMLDLTQQEYVLKIEQLNHELVQAWNTDQRVKALKIAIQCSKLLADTSVMQFYPSQFVLITDILDIFGKLVYERLRTKAEYYEPGSQNPMALPENFTPDMVPAAAKETCQNWFYKIASIRELLPRLYVEIAILKSYSFLTQTEFTQALNRLTLIIRGIGDPLVAIYARCYLCRVGMTVTTDRSYIKENLNDFLFVYHTMFSGGIRAEIGRQRFDMTGYLSLYTPALDWIIQALADQGSEVLLDEIIQIGQEKKNNGLLLNSIMTSFKPTFIANRALQFVNVIANSTTEGLTKSQLFRSLGLCLNLCSPPNDQKLPVLNVTWKIISTFTILNEYMSCVEVWAQYISQHFGLKETNTLMGEIILRTNQNRSFENHYSELQSIMDKIMVHTKHFEILLTSTNFLPFIDLFQKDSVRIDVCKNIMIACKNKTNGKKINDSVVTYALMYICKVLNDSVNELTVEDERRHISNLISNFIRKIDFGREFEKQLTFYVDARGTFPNLDGVFVTLVHCVNTLAMDTRQIMNGQHNRKTQAFVKACAAYSFITIPSIVSVMTRMDLYLLSGQVALVNLCLGQADACFHAAIHLVNDLPKFIELDSGKPKSTEPYLVSFLCNFLSLLIIVPDSPEQGVLFLTRTLLDVIKTYPFDLNTTSLAVIYLNLLDMLTVCAQETYPYHIPNVVSNDELYGSDRKFIAEINSMCSDVVDQLLIQFKLLGDGQNLRAQSLLVIELFLKIIYNADIGKEKMFQLAGNLWNLAMKNRAAVLDSKLPGKILLKVERFKGRIIDHERRHALEVLTTKMKTRM